MLVVISPAKKLDFKEKAPVERYTTPKFLSDTEPLIKSLRKLSSIDLSKLMKLSDKLSDLNRDRYKSFETPFTLKNAKQAMYAFQGDTYVGLEAHNFQKNQIDYAQKHLKILSGLYGILSPLDLIQPYRLEMGTNFGVGKAKNLYQYWGAKLTEHVNSHKDCNFLLNCASKEYFSVLDSQNIKPTVITPHFKVNKGGQLKVIGIYAKKARGACAKFVIENEIKCPEDVKKFNGLGFKFDKKLSDETNFVFVKND